MMQKSAEAMKTTVDASQKKLEELHDDPKGHEDKTSKEPVVNGEAAWNEFLADGPKLLGRTFDGFEASSRGDKSFVERYFSTKDYTSRSPLLRKYAEEGHIPSGATLSESVRAVAGRR